VLAVHDKIIALHLDTFTFE